MSGDIHASVETIRNLEAACQRLASKVVDELPGVKRELRQITEDIEDRRAELRGEIERLRAEVNDADDDEDTDRLERRIEEAREEQARLRRRAQRLEEAATAYIRESRKLEALATDSMRRAQLYLDGAAVDLAAYLAVSLDAVGGGGAARGIGISSAAAGTDGIASVPLYELTRMPLPEGFVWVPIREVGHSPGRGGFDSEPEFTKGVTREEMVRGFTALQTVILPAVASLGAHQAAAWCAAQDQQVGSPMEKSLQRVFDAFFGDEHIYLERGRGDADLFEITNGAHRIYVAAGLGWPAIPAKISDLRSL